jgi:hypothetical protein
MAPPTKPIETKPDIPASEPSSAQEVEHSKDLADLANNLQKHTIKVHRHVVASKCVGIGLATFGGVALVVAGASGIGWFGVVGAVMLILSAGFVALSIERSGEERRYYDHWKRAKLACDLFLFKTTPDGCKADKLLSNNDEQLRSYYELNLTQCSKIFWVGILCLAAGICVVAATLSSVMGAKDDHAQTVIGAVGGAGAILINFVAVVFLKMHSEILTLLKEFQSKLVDTQELYLANVLASRIVDENKRYDAFKDLSYVMAADAHSCAKPAYAGARPPGKNGSSAKDN